MLCEVAKSHLHVMFLNIEGHQKVIYQTRKNRDGNTMNKEDKKGKAKEIYKTKRGLESILSNNKNNNPGQWITKNETCSVLVVALASSYTPTLQKSALKP